MDAPTFPVDNRGWSPLRLMASFKVKAEATCPPLRHISHRDKGSKFFYGAQIDSALTSPQVAGKSEMKVLFIVTGDRLQKG